MKAKEEKEKYHVIPAIVVSLLWKEKEYLGLKWSKKRRKESHFEERINIEDKDTPRWLIL